MNWYTAKLVYIIEKNFEKQATEIEEKLVLVKASTRVDALTKAHEIGIEKQEQISLFNGNSLFWKFMYVVSLDLIENWDSGIEIYSCIKEIDSISQLDYFKYQGNKLMMD